MACIRSRGLCSRKHSSTSRQGRCGCSRAREAHRVAVVETGASWGAHDALHDRAKRKLCARSKLPEDTGLHASHTVHTTAPATPCLTIAPHRSNGGCAVEAVSGSGGRNEGFAMAHLAGEDPFAEADKSDDRLAATPVLQHLPVRLHVLAARLKLLVPRRELLQQIPAAHETKLVHSQHANTVANRTVANCAAEDARAGERPQRTAS